VAIVPYSSV